MDLTAGPCFRSKAEALYSHLAVLMPLSDLQQLGARPFHISEDAENLLVSRDRLMRARIKQIEGRSIRRREPPEEGDT